MSDNDRTKCFFMGYSSGIITPFLVLLSFVVVKCVMEVDETLLGDAVENTEFVLDERVNIVKGFFRDQEGICKNYRDGLYYVEVEGIDVPYRNGRVIQSAVEWMPSYFLEKKD